MTKIKIIRLIFGNYIPLIVIGLLAGIGFIFIFPSIMFRASINWVQSEDSFVDEIINAYKELF